MNITYEAANTSMLSLLLSFHPHALPFRFRQLFKELIIEPKNLPMIDLSFLFSLIKNIKGSDVGGWLETTYLSGDDLRIGRGNKGTMFVLTRDPGAVQP